MRESEGDIATFTDCASLSDHRRFTLTVHESERKSLGDNYTATRVVDPAGDFREPRRKVERDGDVRL